MYLNRNVLDITITEKSNKILTEELHANGQSVLHEIVKENDLKYPTSEMQALMDERNRKLFEILTSDRTNEDWNWA